MSLDKMIVYTFKFVKFNVNHKMDLEMEIVRASFGSKPKR